MLVFVHGLAEHSGRYDRAASWFAARDFSVHALDHRGHGASGGEAGHVASLEDFVEDLALFVDRVSREHAGLPLVLWGHSMGGLLALMYLASRRPDLDAAVTSGAALALGPAWSPLRLFAAKVFGRLAPRLRVKNSIDPNDLSRDPGTAREYREDPLVRKHISLGLGRHLAMALSGDPIDARAIRTPLLLLHGEADTLCPAAGSRDFAGRLSAGERELIVYPMLRHEILNEPERERVMGDALSWMEGRGL